MVGEGGGEMRNTHEDKHTNTHEQERTSKQLLEMTDYWGMKVRGGNQKLRAEPRDHRQRSDWLLPSDRYAYAHARAIAINTPAFEQTSFSNIIRRTRSDNGGIYNN